MVSTISKLIAESNKILDEDMINPADDIKGAILGFLSKKIPDPAVGGFVADLIKDASASKLQQLAASRLFSYFIK